MRSTGYVGVMASLLLVGGGVASAGWSGSGGRLFNDEGNPWWVQNTQVVPYCVAADEDTFGLTTPRLKELVTEALRYWQDNLAMVFPADSQDDWSFRIGTQQFVAMDCGPSVDLTFQFGFLTPEQQTGFASLGDPRDFVAMAVRTAYDARQMRAKGFVYVAPEDGPLVPNIRDIVPRMWSSDLGSRRLMLTLLHELGHVFGVPHSPNADLEGGDFMQESYPEHLVTWESARVRGSKAALGQGSDLLPGPIFLGSPAGYTKVGVYDFYATKLLHLTPSDPSIWITYRWERRGASFDLYAKSREMPERRLAVLAAPMHCHGSGHVLELYIPRGQRVSPEPFQYTRGSTGYECDMFPELARFVELDGRPADMPVMVKWSFNKGEGYIGSELTVFLDNRFTRLAGPLLIRP